MISGTPTTITPSIAYTITATNTGGFDTKTLTIIVDDQSPVISYSQTTFTFTKGTAISVITPSTSGGAVVALVVNGIGVDVVVGVAVLPVVVEIIVAVLRLY